MPRSGGTLSPDAKREGYSTLAELIEKAIRRAGDFSSTRQAVGMRPLFIEFANELIEDLRFHPYWDNPDLTYYVSADERRPIPDMIVLHGLVAKYKMQQESAATGTHAARYHRTLNQLLYVLKFGGPQRHELTAVDGGSGNDRIGGFGGVDPDQTR